MLGCVSLFVDVTLFYKNVIFITKERKMCVVFIFFQICVSLLDCKLDFVFLMNRILTFHLNF